MGCSASKVRASLTVVVLIAMLAVASASTAQWRGPRGFAPDGHALRPPRAATESASSPGLAPATPPSAAGKLVAAWSFDGPAGALESVSGWHAAQGGGGWGNNELEYYTARPANAALDGQGNLALTARRERYGDNGITRDFTSARLQTLGSFALTSGRVEARIKLPAGRGLWPAFWLLGSDIGSVGWPRCGEIDVMENLGQDPFTFFGSVHGPTATGTPWGKTAAKRSASSLAAAYHVYGINWGPGRIDFTFDGSVYATRTPESLGPDQRWAFDGKPFYLLLNLAVGGTWPGSPTATTPFPASMLIDWVHVYSS
jgi:beta-glucanase (GH16 family)